MRRTLGWILFIVGFIVLCWWARGHQAKDIEAIVTQGADELTEKVNAESASVNIGSTVSGRDIHLSGTMPADKVEEIKDQYMDVKGRRVVTTDGLSDLEAMTPYILDATKQGDQGTVKGYAPNDASLEMLNSTFANADNVQIDIAAGAPENWDVAVKTGAMALEMLDYGELKIVDQDVTLTGFAADETVKADAEAKIAGLPSNFKGNATIDLPVPEEPVEPVVEETVEPVVEETVEVAPVEEEANSCDGQIVSIMENQSITFITGSADLDPDSGAVLDELAEPAQACLAEGGRGLEIGGHTDADGDEAANQALSQARAEAVRSALEERGVDVTNVKAVGYGESQPIADNETPEGKAQNRRTTFTWVELN